MGDYHRLYPNLIASGAYTDDPNFKTHTPTNPTSTVTKKSDDDYIIPIHLIWGTNDVVTPISGGVGSFYTQMASSRYKNKVTMRMIKGAGHVPFDDNPVDSQS